MALFPLESNPDVMNKFLENMGVPKKWQVVDVYGLDPDLMAVTPKPVIAVLLLFPTSEKNEQFRELQDAEIKKKGQTIPANIYFMKQYIQNACGTVALIHSIANNQDKVELGDGYFKQCLDESKDMSPEDRGQMLLKWEGVINAHNNLALEGQTEAPDPSEPVNYHFASFVCINGELFELDGRKSFPINHGPTTPDTLLEDSAKVLREYMSLDPDDIRFTVTALAASD